MSCKEKVSRACALACAVILCMIAGTSLVLFNPWYCDIDLCSYYFFGVLGSVTTTGAGLCCCKYCKCKRKRVFWDEGLESPTSPTSSS